MWVQEAPPMRHEDRNRREFDKYDDRREAKMRDKERGQARKIKNALQQAMNAAPKFERQGNR